MLLFRIKREVPVPVLGSSKEQKLLYLWTHCQYMHKPSSLEKGTKTIFKETRKKIVITSPQLVCLVSALRRRVVTHREISSNLTCWRKAQSFPLHFGKWFRHWNKKSLCVCVWERECECVHETRFVFVVVFQQDNAACSSCFEGFGSFLLLSLFPSAFGMRVTINRAKSAHPFCVDNSVFQKKFSTWCFP